MVVVVLALFGGVIGAALFSDFGGFAFGLIVGALTGWVSELASRVRKLESRLEVRKDAEARGVATQRVREPAPASTREAPAPAESPLMAEPRAAAEPPAAPTRPAAEPSAAAAPPPRRAPLDREPDWGGVLAERHAAAASEPPPRSAGRPGSADRARAIRRTAPEGLEPSVVEQLFANVVRWFTTGNLPVKIGVLLSLFGVGFLVKEGIDRNLVPIELRLMAVALFGIVLLAIGWRLRARHRTYSLSIQGGGIGILYLTIYASFGIYSLLPATLAFGLLVGVTAAAGTLAVAQDARALAILGTLGGFLAPVLTSTDSGNHVALFSYYAVLDLAILGIAWFKAWRALNVLGFLFTFGIGTLWGIDGYTPEKFATTEPFLVLFTAMYLVIPVLFATRVEPKLRGFVDGTLTFGTPIAAFTLQSQLVANTEYGLAISAVVFALYYAGMATYLFRTQRETLRVLVEAQLALAVAFVTVAVPLALDARWTSAAWALQGAALVWLAYRQDRLLALLAGLALQALAGLQYVEQPRFAPAEWPVLNGYFLGALLLALAAFFSARLLDPEREQRAENPPVHESLGKLMSIGLFVWAAGWWFFAGFSEIDRAFVGNELALLLGFAAATTVVSLSLVKRIDWPRLDWLGLTLWPIAALLALASVFGVAHPAASFGWLAWPAAIGTMLWFLREREAQFAPLAGALHLAGYWLAVGLAAWEAHWLVERAADGIWPEAAVLAFGAAVTIATLRASKAVGWPFAAHTRAYGETGCGVVLAALTFAAVGLNVGSPGNAAPLAYVPLLNPLELASVLVLFALLDWLGARTENVRRYNPALEVGAQARPAIAAVAAWFLVTMAVGRAVHHWAGVPYELESLAESTTFQSALSIVWSLAGIAAMIFGTRAAQRSVWIAGAALMTIVVAKLFLVDLGNTDTLARVVSFLGVGLLFLVVGYFAPVPPRAAAEPRAA